MSKLDKVIWTEVKPGCWVYGDTTYPSAVIHEKHKSHRKGENDVCEYIVNYYDVMIQRFNTLKEAKAYVEAYMQKSFYEKRTQGQQTRENE